MKVLYIEWKCYCAEDVKKALRNLGYEVKTISVPEIHPFELNDEFSEAVEYAIGIYNPDIVFSMNFFPSVSVACNESSTKYVSWIYDNPHTAVYDKEVKNECNYVFTFDSYMVSQLHNRGVEHVYYAPLAVNAARLRHIVPNAEDVKRFKGDISFVGSLYNESTDYFGIYVDKAKNEYFRGFLEGLLNAQKKVYGYNFMAECLTSEVLNVFREVGANVLHEQSLMNEAEMYADVYLSKKLATMNRIEILFVLGNFFEVNLYTYKESVIPNVNHKGTVSYYEEMPKVFKTSLINLCDTRRSIKNGISLRAMDIMGCGGFLLCNYQEDFYRHFEPDVHMVLYGSVEEAVDKCKYYLRHENERIKIGSNAYEIMAREHTYEIRLNQMFKVLMGQSKL